jgi:hypothetical protein
VDDLGFIEIAGMIERRGERRENALEFKHVLFCSYQMRTVREELRMFSVVLNSKD